MNKKIFIVFLIIAIVIGVAVIGVVINNTNNSKNSNIVENNSANYNIVENNKENNMESGEIMNTSIKVIINNKIYNATLEQNEASKQFINMLPKEFNMSELNGNEKYVYLDTTLPTNSYNPNHIEAGDIMLFGNNCLVVFYKSFNSPYSYTKIGHIENIGELGNKNVLMKFEK